MLIERLQEHYRALANAEHEPFRFRPSGLGSCLREAAFLLGGMEPYPSSPESMRTFELGHQRGLALETACKALWDDCQTQVPITIQAGKYALTGSCDVWIPSQRLLVDFKTIGGYGAGMLSSEGVSEEYQLQIHAYRHGIWQKPLQEMGVVVDTRAHFNDPDVSVPVLGRPKSLADIRCVVVYECKDSDARKGITAGGLIELEVPYSDDLEKRYQARLKELELLLDLKEQGTLDPTLVAGLPKSHWRCRMGPNDVPKYCRVGSLRGGCHK